MIDKAVEGTETIDFDGLKIITVCRLDIRTKGLDRAVAVANKLRNEGYRFKWFVVGDGPDKRRLERMIAQNDLGNVFILTGPKLNPYSYLKNSDVFVLPSRNEGRPVSVTEAQILGVPVVVTNYSAASEQVINGIDGLIADNSESGLYYTLKTLLEHPDDLAVFRKNLKCRDFSNEYVIDQFYKLIE